MFYRKAKISDVESIHGLINKYAEQGLMLARPRTMLYECLRDFTVAEDEGRLVAAGALHILWEDLAEVRALAVAPEYVGQGVGRVLVERFAQEARDLGMPKVFTLTYQPGFFEKCGFTTVDKEDLPHKVWKECINCPKFPNCDENALIMEL
ncbi:MAG: N-acetyltransferase [Clostridia bacterium]|nr:N-acetyltransferase [Clostridia bacterium]